MKTKNNILTLCLCLFCFSSCKQECFEFPEYLVGYFPYTLDQKLVFRTALDDSISFTIHDIYKSKKYFCNQLNLYSKCSCHSRYSINTTNETANFSIYPSQGYAYSTLVIRIKQSSFYLNAEIDAFDSNNSSLFGDTVILENSNNTEFTRVKLIKGLGITEFYNAETDELWTLSE